MRQSVTQTMASWDNNTLGTSTQLVVDKRPDFFMNPRIENVGGRDVMTNVHAPEQKSTLVFDSRFGDSGGPTSLICSSTNTFVPSPITVQLKSRIAKISQMQICSCEFPMSFYQYSASLQNTTFAIDNELFTIPNGNYSLSTIVDGLENTVGISPLTFRAVNDRVSITNNSENAVTIQFAVTADMLFDKYRMKTKLGWCIGFRNPSYVIPAGNTIVSDASFQPQTVKYVYIAVCDFVPQSRTSMLTCAPESGGSILARITLDIHNYPMNTILPAVEQRGYLKSGCRQYSGASDIEKISVYFCDEYGRVLDINRTDFSIGFDIIHH